MLRLSIALVAFAVLLLVLASPSPAAERFAGVTEPRPHRRLHEPEPVRADEAEDRPRARGAASGSWRSGAARAASSPSGPARGCTPLDLATARAAAIGPSFAQGLRGSRFSLAVAPGGDRARLLSDVGQDLVVDLASGLTAVGPGLRRQRDGAPLGRPPT